MTKRKPMKPVKAVRWAIVDRNSSYIYEVLDAAIKEKPINIAWSFMKAVRVEIREIRPKRER